MPSIEVRPFRRADRDQLAALVNAHAAAVVPGAGVSVAAVLSHLERQPGETITDPWVAERATLVAEQQHTVVAAAHLLRYFTDERAGASYRGSGDIRWLLFWPVAPEGNPYWSDATEAAEVLIAACLRQLEEWGVTSQDAGGDLPVRGVYGVPEQWPHIRALYRRAGFAPAGSTEAVYLAQVDDLPRRGAQPVAGLAARRSVGMNGTRLSAVLGEQAVGYIEVEIFEDAERLPRHGRWADIGNLHVTGPAPEFCRCRPLASGYGHLRAHHGPWTALGREPGHPGAGRLGGARVLHGRPGGRGLHPRRRPARRRSAHAAHDRGRGRAGRHGPHGPGSLGGDGAAPDRDAGALEHLARPPAAPLAAYESDGEGVGVAESVDESDGVSVGVSVGDGDESEKEGEGVGVAEAEADGEGEGDGVGEATAGRPSM
jgi:hypothetical protein